MRCSSTPEVMELLVTNSLFLYANPAPPSSHADYLVPLSLPACKFPAGTSVPAAHTGSFAWTVPKLFLLLLLEGVRVFADQENLWVDLLTVRDIWQAHGVLHYQTSGVQAVSLFFFLGVAHRPQSRQGQSI